MPRSVEIKPLFSRFVCLWQHKLAQSSGGTEAMLFFFLMMFSFLMFFICLPSRSKDGGRTLAGTDNRVKRLRQHCSRSTFHRPSDPQKQSRTPRTTIKDPRVTLRQCHHKLRFGPPDCSCAHALRAGGNPDFFFLVPSFSRCLFSKAPFQLLKKPEKKTRDPQMTLRQCLQSYQFEKFSGPM